MDEGVVGKDGQSGCDSDSVVGSEGCAVCAHPFAVDDCLYGGVFKVEVFVVAFADHIHVAL